MFLNIYKALLLSSTKNIDNIFVNNMVFIGVPTYSKILKIRVKINVLSKTKWRGGKGVSCTIKNIKYPIGPVYYMYTLYPYLYHAAAGSCHGRLQPCTRGM